jgi:hypothetical protein
MSRKMQLAAAYSTCTTAVAVILLALEAGAGDVPAFECHPLAPLAEIQFGVASGDLNADGKKDLAVTYLDKSLLGLFLNRGGRRFELTASVPAGAVPRGIACGDADDDGLLDIAVANAGSNDVTLTLGDGKGGALKTASLLTGISPFQPAFADLDGDGHLDLISVNETNPGPEIDGQVTILFGGQGPGLRRHLGGGVFSEVVRLSARVHPASIAVADFDGKNGADLAVVNWQSASISVFLHEGGRKFSAPTEIQVGGALTYSIFSADFDGNGTFDLAASEIETPAVHIFSGDGRGRFTKTGTHQVGSGARWVTGADLDADGRMDLVTANTAAHTVSVLMGDGKGGFAKAVDIGVGTGPRMVLADDLDGDGKVDLAVANGRSPAVTLLWQTAGAGRPCPQVEVPGKERKPRTPKLPLMRQRG